MTKSDMQEYLKGMALRDSVVCKFSTLMPVFLKDEGNVIFMMQKVGSKTVQASHSLLFPVFQHQMIALISSNGIASKS